MVKQHGIFLALCFGLCCLMACSPRGANWSVTPSVSLNELYDSNVNFRFKDEQSDFVTTLTPVVSVKGDTGRTHFQSDTTVNFEKYLDHSELDNASYDLGNVLSYNLTERLSTDVSAHFAKDTTMDTQIDQAGILTERADRYLFDGGLGQTYAISERMSASLKETVGNALYPDGEFPDSFLWQLESDLGYSLTPRDTLRLSLSYAATDYSYSTDKVLPVEASQISTLQEMLFWERLINETTKLNIGVGFRTTWTETYKLYLVVDPDGIRTDKEKLEGQDSAPVFSLSLAKAWTERFSTTFSAGKEQYSSADARSFDRTYGAFTLTYKLSDVTMAYAALRYDYNETDEVTQEKRNYLRFAPSIERKLGENFTLRLRGVYETQMREFSGFEGDADRYQVSLQLTYRWPQFLSNK